MGKEGVPEQRVVPDLSTVKSAELTPRAKRECIKMEPQLGGFRMYNYPTGKEGVHEQIEGLQTQRVALIKKCTETSLMSLVVIKRPRFGGGYN